MLTLMFPWDSVSQLDSGAAASLSGQHHPKHNHVLYDKENADPDPEGKKPRRKWRPTRIQDPDPHYNKCGSTSLACPFNFITPFCTQLF